MSGASLIPFSGGASGVVAAIGVSAGLASGAQCINGFFRVRNELVDPARNDYLDSEEWYQSIMIGLDSVSLLGAGASLLTTVRLVNVAKTSTGKTPRQVLKGLNRQERARLTTELLSVKHPEMTRRMIKLKQMTGGMPKRHTPTEIRRGTFIQMQEALGAALGIASSALAGNIRIIAVGLYEEMPE